MKGQFYYMITNDIEYALNRGIINEDDVLKLVNEMKRSEILKDHPFEIWEGKDGRWRTYLPNNEGGRKLVAKSSKGTLEDTIINYYNDQLDKPKTYTFEQLYYAWLDRHRLSVKKQTIERIEVDFKKFYTNAFFLNQDVTKLKVYELEYWLEKQIVDYNMTKRNFYNMQTILKNTLKFGGKIKLLSKDIWDEFDINIHRADSNDSDHKSERGPQIFNNEERPLVVEQAWKDYYSNPSYIVPLMILLCNQLGLRNGELCALKPGDILNESIKIRRQEEKFHDSNGNLIRMAIEDSTKTPAAHRTIPLSEKAKEVLSYVSRDGKFLFEMNGERITTCSTDAYIRRLCKKINIEPRSMHKIRKTYISKLFEIGLHPEKIREISGHDDLDTLYKHYCFCNQTDREIAEKINLAS